MLPEGWQLVRLGDVARIYDGTHMTPNYTASGVPFYSVEHLTSGDFSNTKFIAEDVFERESKRVVLERGDILMTRIGDIGTARLIDWDVRASFYVSLALIKPDTSVDPRFLTQAIASSAFQKELDQRTLHIAFPKKINLGEINDCMVLLPTLTEQRRIATMLGAWDDAIASSERLVAAQHRRWSGLIQRLILENPAPRIELSTFTELVKDKVAVQEGLFDHSIELDNVESGTGRLLNVTIADVLTGQRAAFRAEDTLFAKLRPYLRKTHFAEEDGMASTEMWVLRANLARCLPRYLYYLVRSPIFEAEANRPTGSRMPRADWEWVAETPLPLPGLNEQGQIVQCFWLRTKI